MPSLHSTLNSKIYLFLVVMAVLGGCTHSEEPQTQAGQLATPAPEPVQAAPEVQQGEQTIEKAQPTVEAPEVLQPEPTGVESIQHSGRVSWFELWKDPTEGAFSILVPKGWSADGSIRRVNTDPSFLFEGRQGVSSVFFNIPEPVQFWEPTAYTYSIGYPEGTWVREYGIEFYILRYHTSRKYISDIILPQLQQSYPDAKITSIQDLPDVAQAYGEPIATQTDASSATITFTSNGVPMKAGYTVITDRVIMGQDLWTGEPMGIWIARVIGAVAPESEFDDVSGLYSQMLSTLRVDPTWLQYELKGKQERSEMIRSSGKRLMEMDYKMFREESESSMRIAKGWMNALGGSETARDEYGTEYTVSTGPGMNYYWTDNAGSIVATEFDAAPDVGFTRMETIG